MTLIILFNLVTFLNNLDFSIKEPLDQVTLLARLGCSEAGHDYAEVKRVLRVVYNRSIRNNTTVFTEATRKSQFYYKNCRGKQASWLKWRHFELAILTLSGKIKADEAVLNDTATLYFATTTRLAKKHPRCKNHTIRQVWKWYGLQPVLKTKVGHEYFKKARGKYGCPN